MLPDYNNSNPHVNMPTRIIEKDSSGSYTKGIVVGTLVGGAVGAAVALLFAPKPGNELRKDIADRSSDVTSKATGYFKKIESDVHTVVNSAINEGKVKADGIISSAKKQADDLVRSADQVLKDAKLKVSEARTSYGEKVSSYKDAAKAGVDAFKSEIADKITEVTDSEEEKFTGAGQNAPGFSFREMGVSDDMEANDDMGLSDQMENSDEMENLGGSKFDLDGSLSDDNSK